MYCGVIGSRRFGARCQSEAVDVQQQATRDAQSFAHVAAVVHVRIVDQAFPSDGGARLFEIHAHHDVQAVRGLVLELRQAVRGIHCSVGVVDGARADDAEHPAVASGEDLADGLARLDNGARNALVHRHLVFEEMRGDQRFGGAYVDVLYLTHKQSIFIGKGASNKDGGWEITLLKFETTVVSNFNKVISPSRLLLVEANSGI